MSTTHVALSPRRLTTQFRAEHTRDAVVRTVATGCAPDLARVAAECGYYDHSHLVRDFRQYTGLSPTAWPAEECRNIHGRHRGP
ncbi:helix-turn-helix domain-containing protein [Streptomyces bicolor]|uniref:helix-turn-helix domain-containing protein n=1 Tax=Streptomyces bicolor TaxID=66874 RepID=UPI001F1EBEFE|nr:helix-turn-helix domain-containing protein [Streptomyces bicolor]